MESRKVDIFGECIGGNFDNCTINIYGRTYHVNMNNCNIKNYGRMDYIRGDIQPEVKIKEVVKVEYRDRIVEVEKPVYIKQDSDKEAELGEKVRSLHGQIHELKERIRKLENQRTQWEYEPNRFDLINISKNLHIFLGEVIDEDESGRYEWIDQRNGLLRKRMLEGIKTNVSDEDREKFSQRMKIYNELIKQGIENDKAMKIASKVVYGENLP